ncbi:hypothetical protein ACIQGZ_02375 [Streptomyces sp. NPDC092296]|uniref:hypothetical protein n=1 Tax=Streptomyces sp. NPDC092296 TaxID=3366012 RepID=UPI00380BD18B
MPHFTLGTLALIDDADDRDRSSDGDSRYGAYLALHAAEFHDGGPLGAVEFARTVWWIATSPVMSPGYVRIRPDLHSLAPVITDDGLALRIDVPVRHHALAHRPTGSTGDWQTDPWDRSGNPWPRLTEPGTHRHPALLLTATLLIPVPDSVLTVPTAHRPGPALTRQAKHAVKALVRHANAHAHLVDDLAGEAR